MEPWILICIGLAAACILITFIAYNCFDDNDPDQDWYDNYAAGEFYQEAGRPYVELPFNCKHEGDKTLVTVSSPVNYEVVHTVCDDCGQTLNVDVDVR